MWLPTSILIVFLIFILGVLSLAYYLLLKKFKELTGNTETIEDQARTKAVKIIEEARDRAMNILKEARVDFESESEKIDEQMQSVSEAELIKYKQSIQNISKDIENQAMMEIKEFKEALRTGTIGVQKAAASKIERVYNEVEAEVEEYKKQRIQAVRAKMKLILQEVINTIAGKSVSVDVQAESVREAVEEAIKNHDI